jgi:hypothetical protein
MTTDPGLLGRRDKTDSTDPGLPGRRETKLTVQIQVRKVGEGKNWQYRSRFTMKETDKTNSTDPGLQ